MTECTYDQSNIFIQKAKGSLLGLALGDSLGTTLEFKRKDGYRPISDIVGGGYFELEPGQWTDDTSMALCLADSLISKRGHDALDQMTRYHRWREFGENSVTGSCFGIGRTVNASINRFVGTGEPNAGSRAYNTAGNGSIMRLAPVAIFYSPTKNIALNIAIDKAKDSSIVTHAEPRTIEAYQIMAWLLFHIFDGANNKEKLFNDLASAFTSLTPQSKSVASGSFLTKERYQIFGTGFVIDSLEAALWCFANSDGFEEGALLAANLGDDADTTAAVYGQLAGAFYGVDALPIHWLEKLAWRKKIEETAERLALIQPAVNNKKQYE